MTTEHTQHIEAAAITLDMTVLYDLREAYKNSTQGEWQKGATTHHTVTGTGYKIAEFHHAADASFCDVSHKHMPALLALVDALTAERDAIKQQAQIWKMEAMAHKSTGQECYQACTGSTGEPGDWNGANPVRELVKERDAALTLAADRKSMLLWALYNHQGGSSPIGQPIRKALGIGQHDDLMHAQVVEACDAAKAAS